MITLHFYECQLTFLITKWLPFNQCRTSPHETEVPTDQTRNSASGVAANHLNCKRKLGSRSLFGQIAIVLVSNPAQCGQSTTSVLHKAAPLSPRAGDTGFIRLRAQIRRLKQKYRSMFCSGSPSCVSACQSLFHIMP